MSRLTNLQLYFWLSAIGLTAFIYYKFKKLTDHVYNHFLYFLSLMSLLSRLLCIIILAIDPFTKVNMIFAGLCIISQGWLVFGTLALIQKRPSEQDHPNNQTQLAEDIATIKAFFNNPASPKIAFIFWNIATVFVFWLSMTSFAKESNPYGGLLIVVSYFGTAWIFSHSNRENLLPEASSKMDLLVTGFIVLGVIDTISLGMSDFFVDNFYILQSGFYIFECVNAHNFSRLFTYNERISFVEFAQPRETVNLDMSHRKEEPATPSVQELKDRHDEETNEGEEGRVEDRSA